MSTTPHNIRHALKAWVPNWLADIPGFRTGFTILFTIAVICDAFVEVMFQGLQAARPGKGTPTANPYLGRARGFVQGFYETSADYAARLITWLDLWHVAGSDALLGKLVQGYLGNAGSGLPVVRVVDRRGRFTTINADGSVTKVTDTNWNFDATGLPERAGWWSDVWILVYITDGRFGTYTSLTDPAWQANWGKYNQAVTGVGLILNQAIPSTLLNILSVFKGAHSFIEAIVFTSDNTIFIPGSLGSTYPNGHWGNFSEDISDVQTRVRPITTGSGYVRFMIPNNGG